MPCDGEGGGYMWDEYENYESDRTATFDLELKIVSDWLFNREPKELDEDENVVDDDEKIDDSAEYPQDRLSYENGASPLENLLFFSVGGATNEFDFDPSSPYVRDWKNDRADMDSAEEMMFAFTQIHQKEIDEYSVKKSYQKLGFSVDIKDGVFSLGFESLGDRRDDYHIFVIDEFDDGWGNLEQVVERSRIVKRTNRTEEESEKQSSEHASSSVAFVTQMIDDSTIALVFEFIDTKFLIDTCTFVCPQWHKIILYNPLTINQIFMGRTLSYFKNDESIRKLNQWYNLNWLETYVVSGMYQFELFGEHIKRELERLASKDTVSFYYMILNLDPVQHLKFLPTDHILIQNLSKHQAKRVLFSVNSLENTTKRYISLGQVNHFVEMKRGDLPLTFLHRSLFCVNRTVVNWGLSVDILSGIPLYIDFLKSISKLLISPLLDVRNLNQEETMRIYRCMLEMVEKAQYFLEFIVPKHPSSELVVEDDILIGLHLILLDNFYIEHENVFNLPLGLNMKTLLENRKQQTTSQSETDYHSCINRPTKTCHHLLPPHLKGNLLELALCTSAKFSTTIEEHQFTASTSSSLNPFHQPSNAISFLVEHVIELSEIIPEEVLLSTTTMDEWINEHAFKYLNFIVSRTDPSTMPSKSIDLFFHFHMLHPSHFVQDSLRLTKRIKAHNFNFQRPSFNFNMLQ